MVPVSSKGDFVSLLVARYRFLALTLSLSLLGCGSQATKAQSASTPGSRAQGEGAKQPPAGLFLYAIGEGEPRSYVMGTMHVGFGFDEVLTAEARRYFAAARAVMLEADVTTANPEQMMQAALLSPGESLQAMMGEPLWGVLVSRVGDTLPPPMLDKLKPWMPAVILGLADMQRALEEVRPGAERHMMDMELMQSAQKAGKQLLFLESMEEQLAVFTAIPDTEQLAELKRSLSEENAALGRTMIDAFARGDEAALTSALFDETQMLAAPGFYDAVLFQRNARWLPIIERQLRAGGVFMAVGAAHLFGERGILAELAQRGHRITRVGG